MWSGPTTWATRASSGPRVAGRGSPSTPAPTRSPARVPAPRGRHGTTWTAHPGLCDRHVADAATAPVPARGPGGLRRPAAPVPGTERTPLAGPGDGRPAGSASPTSPRATFWSRHRATRPGRDHRFPRAPPAGRHGAEAAEHRAGDEPYPPADREPSRAVHRPVPADAQPLVRVEPLPHRHPGHDLPQSRTTPQQAGRPRHLGVQNRPAPELPCSRYRITCSRRKPTTGTARRATPRPPPASRAAGPGARSPSVPARRSPTPHAVRGSCGRTACCALGQAFTAGDRAARCGGRTGGSGRCASAVRALSGGRTVE